MKSQKYSSEYGNIVGDNIGKIIFFGGIAAALLFVIIASLIDGNHNTSSGSDSNAPHTDGVYESAKEKLNKGIPLNDREAKRINDVYDLDGHKRAEEIERRNGER